MKVGRVEARAIPEDEGGVVKVRPGWKPARWRSADWPELTEDVEAVCVERPFGVMFSEFRLSDELGSEAGDRSDSVISEGGAV